MSGTGPDTLRDDEGSVTEDVRAARPHDSEGLARRLAMELVHAKVTGGPIPRVDRYEVLEKIGEGGMGVVFRARDPLLDREVAIKVLRGGASPTDEARIRDEARALARLNHPNVLAVYDMGSRDGQLWFAVELVEAGNLRQWALAQRRLGWRVVAERLLEAARGLGAAHRAGVVHRDVKPDNIMVGEDGRVRVADFGLAVAAVDADGAIPPDRSLAGTPRYWAPELLEGAKADFRTDQFGLCMSMRELLDMMPEQEGAIPEELDALVARGLSEDPGARWSSVGAFVAALDSLLSPMAPASAASAPGLTSHVPTAPPDLSRLLEIASEAENREAFRFEALRWLDGVVGFDTVLLGDPAQQGDAGPRIEGFDMSFVDRFREGADRYAPTLMALVMASLRDRAPVRDVDLLSLSMRAKIPFYNEVIGPKGSKVMVIGGLVAGGAPVGSLQISRAARGTAFSDAELRTIRESLRYFAIGERMHAPAPSLPPELPRRPWQHGGHD